MEATTNEFSVDALYRYKQCYDFKLLILKFFGLKYRNSQTPKTDN